MPRYVPFIALPSSLKASEDMHSTMSGYFGFLRRSPCSLQLAYSVGGTRAGTLAEMAEREILPKRATPPNCQTTPVADMPPWLSEHQRSLFRGGEGDRAREKAAYQVSRKVEYDLWSIQFMEGLNFLKIIRPKRLLLLFYFVLALDTCLNFIFGLYGRCTYFTFNSS